MKVLMAMQKNKVSAECFASHHPATAMMILDEKLWKRFMQILFIRRHALDSFRRSPAELMHWQLLLFGNLRPGDELLAPAGKPYDTLEEVIGIRPSRGSLAGIWSNLSDR